MGTRNTRDSSDGPGRTSGRIGVDVPRTTDGVESMVVVDTGLYRGPVASEEVEVA